MKELESFRSNFPVTNNLIFLNHAATSPLSLPAGENMKLIIDRISKRGPGGEPSIYKAVIETRNLIAKKINVKPSQIAFIGNTSHGLSLAAVGYKWKQGDNIILNDLEFPSNIYPWLNLEKKGVEVKIINSNKGKIDCKELFKSIDKKTKMISLSWVEFSTGYRNNLYEIGELCRKKDILFIVDASQGFGALEVDLSQTYVDLFVSCAHKWLVGPQGLGVIYISDKGMELIEPEVLGWHSVVKAEEYLNYDFTLKTDARRFEEGTLNISGIYGLKGSLELLLSAGAKRIEKRIYDLTEELTLLLKEKKYNVISSRKDEEWSGIVSFHKEGVDIDIVIGRLNEQGIIISSRQGYFRVSPHFYNQKEEIERLVELLP